MLDSLEKWLEVTLGSEDMAKGVECLPSKHKALSSNSSTAKKLILTIRFAWEALETARP
jgi:hypothetical protein